MSKEISKYLVLDMMYRDADNFKSNNEVYLTNHNQIPNSNIIEAIQPLIDDEADIIPNYYDLPTIAPVDNEYLPNFGPDHPYMTITNISFREKHEGHDPYDDISTVLEAINNPDIITQKQKEAKAYAISNIRTILEHLES